MAAEGEVSLVAYHTRRCIHLEVGFHVEYGGNCHSGEYFILLVSGLDWKHPEYSCGSACACLCDDRGST